MSTPDSIGDLALVEIVLRAAKVPSLPISQVQRPLGEARFTRRIKTDGHGIVGLDLTLGVDGHLRLIEANGSNQGASSFGAAEGDLARAQHQVEAARKCLEKAAKGAVLIPYAPGTGLLPEIVVRARLIQKEIERFRSCGLVDASQNPTDPMTVVVDTVPNIVEQIEARGGALYYRGVPVLSSGNPNLLPALVRRGVIERRGAGYQVDISAFHEGPLVELIHDKGAQQKIADGTGIEPLWVRECHDVVQCLEAIGELHGRGLAAVAKMNAGSGGAGIEFFGPSTTLTTVKAGLNRLFQEAATRYGDNVDRSVWPVRVFEFAESTGYPVGQGAHLWDMRVLALISPGKVEMTFCGLRVCPEPFVASRFTRGSVLSNTTGRAPSISNIRSPLVDSLGPTKVLRMAGVDDQVFDKIIFSCAAWCEAAWARYAHPAKDSIKSVAHPVTERVSASATAY